MPSILHGFVCRLASVSAARGAGRSPLFSGSGAGIPTGVTVSVLGCLRLTLLTREPRFGGLDTAGTPRSAAAMPADAIEPDERPALAGEQHRRFVVKERCSPSPFRLCGGDVSRLRRCPDCWLRVRGVFLVPRLQRMNVMCHKKI